MLIFIIILVLFLVLNICKERFISFSSQITDYNDCLSQYRYDNFCSDLLVANRNYKREYGYASAVVNNKQRIFSLYKVVNEETEEQIYYIDIDGKYEYIADINDGDIVTFNNIQYTLFLFTAETYLDIVDPFYDRYRFNYYRINEKSDYDFPFAYRYGIIQDDDDDKFNIYRQISQEEWNYYVGDENVIVPLDDYHNIVDNEQINVDFDDDIYTFQETNY